MNAKEYESYVKTDCWQIRRDAYVSRYGPACEVCGNSIDGLDVHHLTYERLGVELDDDLMGLCRLCHSAVHGVVTFDEWETFITILMKKLSSGPHVQRYVKLVGQVLKTHGYQEKLTQPLAVHGVAS